MRLKDVEEIAKVNPNFQIVPRSMLKNIEKGDVVKVIKNQNPERFWVKITKVKEGGKYEGKIRNILVTTDKYKYGDKIKLERKNIMAIDRLGHSEAEEDIPEVISSRYARY